MECIKKTDAYRSAYYKYYTGKKWENVKNYDLSLDTGIFTYEECVEIISNMVELKLKKA